MIPEVIAWISLEENLPDDEETVLIEHPNLDEPVWIGYHCDGKWFHADGTPLMSNQVTAWAEFPLGMNKLQAV